MAQQRYINFGDTILADRINEISTAIVVPSVLSGAEMSVGLGDQSVVIGPNKVMLNDLLLTEDNDTVVPVTPFPTAPTDYTIVYEHNNQQVQGGVPAQMLLLEGIFGFDDLLDTVVLGWIRYPGLGTGLTETMFTEAPKLQISNPSTFPADIMLPPYSDRIYVQSSTGAFIQTDVYETTTLKAFIEIENTISTLNTVVHYVPFAAGIQPPNRIILEANVELGASVQGSLVDEEGTIYPALDSEITNTSGLYEYREMIVPNIDPTKFTQNRPYFVALTTELNQSRKVRVSIVGTSSNFLPF